MLIGGFQKSSLIDYPEKISAIVFTQGCNFRCPYCHNPELIKDTTILPIDEFAVFEFLQSRIGKLDGVVITGGEPTLQKDLKNFIKTIKKMGFFIKLDTNGTNPQILQELLDENLLDYVAMDIKAPIEKYSEIVVTPVETKDILKSIETLKNSPVDFEFRTTVVKSQLSLDDFEQIGKLVQGAKRYYLQKFVPTKVLNKFFITQQTYSDKEFAQIVSVVEKYVNEIRVR